jgi:hypothetical protein
MPGVFVEGGEMNVVSQNKTVAVSGGCGLAVAILSLSVLYHSLVFGQFLRPPDLELIYSPAGCGERAPPYYLANVAQPCTLFSN